MYIMLFMTVGLGIIGIYKYNTAYMLMHTFLYVCIYVYIHTQRNLCYKMMSASIPWIALS